MRVVGFFLFYLLIITFWGCIDPYSPPEIEDYDDLLVIDANVNSTTGEAVVNLSRTQSLSDEGEITHVSGASVLLEDELGNSVSLVDQGPGRYYRDGLFLEIGEKVRLTVRTSDGNEYQSDFVENKKTPKIDSLSYDVQQSGVQVYVNTHDDQDETWYYRWEYEETWEFAAQYYSSYYFIPVEDSFTVEFRNQADTLYICWDSNNSEDLILGTSDFLERDVISEYPLRYVDATQGKLARKYSILVKQAALTNEAYNYYKLLEANTENLGSLFDPQPSKIIGNIRSVSNPEEEVLGYLNVFSEDELRLFLTYDEVGFFDFTSGYETCREDPVALDSLYLYWRYREITRPRYNGPVIDGYYLTLPYCVDCTLRGSNKRPDFW